MDPVADLAIPVLTVLVMVVVGMELSSADFAQVARPPSRLILATLSQALLLPLVAFAVIFVLDPPLHRKLGLLVIAGSPAGAFSNFFTALARGATALSVALTTTCTLLSVLTLPLVTAVGFALFAIELRAVRSPILLIMGQLLMLLVLPLLAGMAIRRQWEAATLRLRPRLHAFSLACLLMLIVWILVDRATSIVNEALPGVVAASLFLIPAMILGEIVGRFLRWAPAERLAYVVELGFRNIGIAVVVTVTLLRQADFLAFGTVFFVTASIFALAYVAIYRRWLL